MNNFTNTLHKLTESLKPDFKKAIDEFCKTISEFIDKETDSKLKERWQKDNNEPYNKPLSYTEGGKWIRVVIETGGSKAVYCFVESETGDVYKAAGWKAPAKNKPRANIFKKETYEPRLKPGSDLKYSFS